MPKWADEGEPRDVADPTFSAQDFLNAQLVVRSLSQNLAIQFQVEGEGWDRETMQRNVHKRAALQVTQSLLLDEGERLLKD